MDNGLVERFISWYLHNIIQVYLYYLKSYRRIYIS